MIGLLVMIVLCVRIGTEAKARNVSALPYVLGTVGIGIGGSLLFMLMNVEGSIGFTLIGSIISIALMFIPYNSLKGKPLTSGDSDMPSM